ncbi:MAG: ATP-binding protein, partial [Pontibacterium sp.]
SSAAMPNGGVLKFRTCQLKGAQLGEIKGDIVQIQVQDTGCGIEKSHLRRVFEPFFTTKEIGEGSGLGLSMVYGFVKQSNGDIQVHSEPGKGTRIDISLPRSVISIDTRTIEKSPIKLGNGRLVLMVEDDVQVREMGAELLAALDYEVITTHSGEGALAILEARQDIDVLFTDINLGTSTTGMQLAEQVERQWPNIGIVITSGLSMQNLDKRYGITDSHFVLPKPYRTEELAIALQRINDEGS